MATETKINTEIQFNEKSLEAFTKEGLDPPHDVRSEIERIAKFKARFKEGKGKLQIIIKTMNRRQIITYDENGRAVKKEFLTYRADYHAKDWVGNDIWIRSDEHGHSKKPIIRTIMEMNYETGEHIPRKELNGSTDEYYIELIDKNRKEIIATILNSSNGTLIDEIFILWTFHKFSTGSSI